MKPSESILARHHELNIGSDITKLRMPIEGRMYLLAAILEHLDKEAEGRRAESSPVRMLMDLAAGWRKEASDENAPGRACDILRMCAKELEDEVGAAAWLMAAPPVVLRGENGVASQAPYDAHRAYEERKLGAAAFSRGDVVQLKSGGPLMTVSERHDDSLVCVWWADAAIHTRLFDYRTLRRVENR